MNVVIYSRVSSQSVFDHAFRGYVKAVSDRVPMKLRSNQRMK